MNDQAQTEAKTEKAPTNAKSFTDEYMRLWAGDRLMFAADVLGVKPRGALTAKAFGDAATGDFEQAMVNGWLVVLSALIPKK